MNFYGYIRHVSDVFSQFSRNINPLSGRCPPVAAIILFNSSEITMAVAQSLCPDNHGGCNSCSIRAQLMSPISASLHPVDRLTSVI